MYVNASAYQSVHAFKISSPRNFHLFQRFDLKDMSVDVVVTAWFAVSGNTKKRPTNTV